MRVSADEVLQQVYVFLTDVEFFRVANGRKIKSYERITSRLLNEFRFETGAGVNDTVIFIFTRFAFFVNKFDFLRVVSHLFSST